MVFSVSCSRLSRHVLIGACAVTCGPSGAFSQVLPEAIRAPGEKVVFVTHAEGAQIYDCKPDATGKLAWAFREPVATLLEDGKTVGRHYAGPRWEHIDGSVVMAKVVARAAGASPQDIPWLKLEVTGRSGSGKLSDVAIIQRINTRSGVLEGACEKSGDMKSVAYATDYIFLKK